MLYESPIAGRRTTGLTRFWKHPTLTGRLRLERLARPALERVRRLLARYGSEIGALRLITRGVSPAGVTPLKLEEIEISTAQQRAAQVLSFIPMFIILSAFVGGMSIATDSTAGERERGSLEALLVNPFAIDQTAESYARALGMPTEERHARMRSLDRLPLTMQPSHPQRPRIATLPLCSPVELLARLGIQRPGNQRSRHDRALTAQREHPIDR